MRLKFGLRGITRVFDVNTKTDYFLDNGACIQIISKDPAKKQFIQWSWVDYWVFSKARFQKLLQGGFIEKMQKPELKNKNLIYYQFTEKVNEFPGEFK